MTGQYRKVREFPELHKRWLDKHVPGWDDMQHDKFMEAVTTSMAISLSQLVERNSTYEK